MGKEETYHFNLTLLILEILKEKSAELTNQQLADEIKLREKITLDDFAEKNLKERISKKLKYLSRANRIILTKNITPIKTTYYTAKIC